MLTLIRSELLYFKRYNTGMAGIIMSNLPIEILSMSDIESSDNEIGKQPTTPRTCLDSLFDTVPYKEYEEIEDDRNRLLLENKQLKADLLRSREKHNRLLVENTRLREKFKNKNQTVNHQKNKKRKWPGKPFIDENVKSGSFNIIEENMMPTCQCIGSCSTKKCICFISGFECDEKNCSCNERCKNKAILQGHEKKIMLGKSKIPGAGTGAFAVHFIEKGDCIGQYTGELIWHEEGARRAKIYDKKKNSTLIELTPEWYIDAARIGSKLKYMNHSTMHPNVIFNKRFVRQGIFGGPKIGAFAKQNIGVGEELLVTYGPNFRGHGVYTPKPVCSILAKTQDGTHKKVRSE